MRKMKKRSVKEIVSDNAIWVVMIATLAALIVTISFVYVRVGY
jgi:hypothetical protein